MLFSLNPALEEETKPAPLAPDTKTTTSIWGNRYEIPLLRPEDKDVNCAIIARQHGANVTLQIRESEAATTSPLDGHGLEFLIIPAGSSKPMALVIALQENSLLEGTVDIHYQCEPFGNHLDNLDDIFYQAVSMLADAGRAVARGTRVDMEVALKSYEEATQILAALPPSVHSGHAHFFQAALLYELNKPIEALEQFEKAVQQFTLAESSEDTGDVYGNWSQALIDLGRFEEARTIIDSALDYLGEQAPPQLLGSLHSNRGLSFHYQGQLDDALKWYLSAEEKFRLANDQSGLAQITNNMGGIYFDRNDADRALSYFEQAYEAHRQTGNRKEVATALGNKGLIQIRMGNFGGALQSYLRAKRRTDALGNTREMGRINHRLGFMYLRLGNYERAQTYFSQALDQRTESQDLIGQADTLSALGRMYLLQSQPVMAASAATMSLSLFEDAEESDRVPTQKTQLATSLLELPDLPFRLTTAKVLLEEARNTAQELEQRRTQAEILYAQGKLARAQEDLHTALAHFDSSAKMASAEAFPILAAASLLALAQTHLQMNNIEFALETAEQTIAQVESIRSRIASPTLRSQYLSTQRAAFEFLVKLYAERDDAWGALAAAERFRSRRLVESLRWSDTTTSNKRSDSKISEYLAVSRKLNTIAARSGQFSLREKSGNPEWEAQYLDLSSQLDALEADLALIDEPRRLSLQQAATLLKPDEVFYELFLGEEQSWAWTVTQDTIKMVTLPQRSQLEAQTETIVRSLAFPSATPRKGAVTAQRRASEMLLTPLVQAGKSKVLYSPDGFVSLIPLTALHWPVGGYFHSKATAVTTPSLTALARQRNNPSTNTRSKRALLVGAPNLKNFKLAGSRQEVEALKSMWGENADVLLANDAHRAAVMEKPLSSYGLLHFATHGGASTRDGETSGLYLRQASNSDRPTLISEKDVFTWRLNADLVTLSACQTLRGRYLEGEGAQSLARALIYAGARSVLASLWRVDDAATRFLMLAFYESYLANGDAATALVEAQQKTADQPRWRDPYYWAGFQLHASQ